MNRVRYFAGAVAGVRDMLRAPRNGDPAGLIRSGLERRETSFLDLVRRAVFANAGNPFARMFAIAGCGYDDLQSLVRREGLETALAQLHRNGVYLTHDELKLKRPIVRSNHTIPATEASFRNPLIRGGLTRLTGGSRSAGTSVTAATDASVHREAYDALAIEEFDLRRRRQVLLKPILPAVDGLSNFVRAARLGCTLDRWFSPMARSADSLHYRMATQALVLLARANGVALPHPTHLPPNDFRPVARWIAKRRDEGMSSAVITYASAGVRVATAARDLGLSIAGTLFISGGEALTEAKRCAIEAAGVSVFPRYSIGEFGAVGQACRQVTRGNSVHLFEDSIAAIPHKRLAPLSAAPVDSLLFTALQPHAPCVLVNAEMDDAGVIERHASCDCTYGRAGLTTMIRDISSYGKLTGHSVTLVGTDVLRILEDALPGRFGGSAGDYQLVEEDGAGQGRLVLRVSPRVAVRSIDEVKRWFLHALRTSEGGQIASRLWRDADAMDALHQEPIVTGRGKVLALHVLGARGRDVVPHGS